MICRMESAMNKPSSEKRGESILTNSMSGVKMREKYAKARLESAMNTRLAIAAGACCVVVTVL